MKYFHTTDKGIIVTHAIGIALYFGANLIPGFAATLVVSPGKIPEPRCPNPQYASIQLAVNAAKPGDTVYVCPGVYPEQVKITKPLTVTGPSPNPGNDLTDPDDAIIMPTVVAANTTGSAMGTPVAAIILVQNAKNVELTNLTVDGKSNNLAACPPEFVGIFYQNATGDIEYNTVRNIRVANPACQGGQGIVVQNDRGANSDVEISGNSVHDYQKNGITANESATSVRIHDNVVTGLGAAAANPQNGIQVGYGASAEIRNNTVTDNFYPGCTSAANCTGLGTNILIFSANGIRVQDNTAGASNINVYVYLSNACKVNQNTLFHSIVFDGIDLVGNNNAANNNTIFRSDAAAVYVDGTNDTVSGNTINEAQFGVLSSMASNTDADGNKFYNTHIPAGVEMGPANAAAPVNVSSGRHASPARP